MAAISGRQPLGKIDEFAAEGVDLDQAQLGFDVVAQLEQVLQRLFDLDVFTAVHGRKIAQKTGISKPGKGDMRNYCRGSGEKGQAWSNEVLKCFPHFTLHPFTFHGLLALLLHSQDIRDRLFERFAAQGAAGHLRLPAMGTKSRLGMLWMPKAPASSCSLSVSTL